ncbi:myeloid differentiation primary response protein MyD88-like [Oppia nitens]|uniref:myeloid differentiation primary response protein MyD88-like n=1 Tax=Oppia nitens TaxID=1686743 RepID=UPI0023DAF614|nr:myeloid differentiation primary response protein MyD88-like [Oppia nitens]
MSQPIDTDLSEIPLRALSVSTRHQLSEYLNYEQYITTSEGLCRDYRGLAQLMDFSYAVIESLMRTNDPLNGLLDRYQNRSDSSFGKLLQMLEQIERFDIIDDMTPVLMNDAKHYNKYKQSILPSVKSESSSASSGLQSDDHKVIIYDAYVCYADQDFEFVKQLSQYLESDQIGFRLFIRDRDLCLGSWAYESFAETIDKRCNKVLIILSPDFFECRECEFQTMFATGLAIEQRNRKLIPIIYKKCDLPPIIRMLTKIDMTRSVDTHDWAWNRLVKSISNNVSNSSIVFRQNHSNDNKPNLLQLPSISSSNSINSLKITSIKTIDLPSNHEASPQPSAPPLISTQSSISSISSDISIKSDNSESLPIMNAQKHKNMKLLNHKKWIQSLKQKFKN